MDGASEDQEAADSVDNGSGLSLDMITSNYEPKSNLFHLSDVRLVDLLGNNSDLEYQASLYEDYLAEEESVEKWKNIHDAEDHQNVIPRDKSFDRREEKDDDVELQAAQKSFQAPPPSALSIFPTKFTIDSDIEEVGEEHEADNSSVSDVYRDSMIYEEIPWEYSKRITGIRWTKRRSELIGKSASMLEQRLKMIREFKEILEERKYIKMKNSYLDRKCCQFYEKSTTDGPFENIEGASPIYSNTRYQKILEDFMVVQEHYETYKPILENEIRKMTNSYDILSRMFDETFSDYIHREWEIVTNFIIDKPGKLQRKFRVLMKKQRSKFSELSKFRVSHLELNHQLDSLKITLRKLNDLGEGHNLMDYEQLTMVHDTLLDKMDERDEELRTLKEECTNYIVSLSHMKESSDVLIYDMLSATSVSNELTEMKKEARALLAVETTKRDDLRKTITSSTFRHVGLIIEKPALMKKLYNDTEMIEPLKLKVKKLIAHDPISFDADHVFMSAKKSIIRPFPKAF